MLVGRGLQDDYDTLCIQENWWLVGILEYNKKYVFVFYPLFLAQEYLKPLEFPKW